MSCISTLTLESKQQEKQQQGVAQGKGQQQQRDHLYFDARGSLFFSSFSRRVFPLGVHKMGAVSAPHSLVVSAGAGAPTEANKRRAAAAEYPPTLGAKGPIGLEAWAGNGDEQVFSPPKFVSPLAADRGGLMSRGAVEGNPARET